MLKEKEQFAMLQSIRNKAHLLSTKKITLGFDGFIDSVVKVIKHKDYQQSTSYFESTQEFGKYTFEKGEKNFSFELEELTTKLGGNMPIMANAFAQLGPTVSCIGSLGYPAIHPIFKQMQPNCHLHSFANPGMSKVMEFNSGKIMMAEMGVLNRIEWDFIRQTIGIDTILDMFSKSNLIALLNWSELDNSTAVWKGILRDVLPGLKTLKRPIGFFDLSDCSKRTASRIMEAMELIKSFTAYWDVVLSLNLNEAAMVYSVVTQKNGREENAETMCNEIFEKLGINTVIIHYAKQSVAHNHTGLHKRNSYFIQKPVISSGSGDNFNAGFCTGILMGLDIGTSLSLGHATSSLYMQSAQSPTLEQVMEFMDCNPQEMASSTIQIPKGK